MLSRRDLEKLFDREQILGPAARSIKKISIDSRRAEPGDLFIPIKGKKFDGRKFISSALKKGALVLDTRDGLAALHKIAGYHRSKFNIPMIGVTGSTGKTTTKDMIAAILSQEMETLKNEENFNNEIGVPLTLLKLNKKHKAAVIEMAMQGPGEIRLLSKIVRPTISLVTNIGESHLEFLKTRENIAKAKAEIFSCLRKNDYAIINQDDEYYEHLRSQVKSRRSKVISYGILEKADITPKELKGIKLPFPGQHMIYNALAAIAAARILKIKPCSIKQGLENVRLSSRRMEVINRDDRIKIINDTYNANPQSMAAMLDVLSSLEGRKIAVLGDMFELGKRSRAAHQKIGKLARKLGVDVLITIGKMSKEMRGHYHYARKNPAIKKIKSLVRPGDRVLVKASRGMRLEDVVEALRGI